MLVPAESYGALTRSITVDGSALTVVSGAYKSFPGVAWLDRPTATTHLAGDRFIISYRDGSTHLAGGVIAAVICTVTGTAPWAYSVGTPFTIEATTNDLRCEDGISVIDIGGMYYAVVAAREFNDTVNLSPHVLVCNDPAATMTSASTWARHNIALSGHTQDFTQGRVHKLASGLYGLAAGYIAGTTDAIVWLTTLDPTDWSAPTITTITSSMVAGRECDVEQLPSGLLRAALRNDTSSIQEYATSTDDGATWSGLATAFTLATAFPLWRRLMSGAWLDVYRSTAGGAPTLWRSTALGDAGWSAAHTLDSRTSEYATLLQLDPAHILCVYSCEVATNTATLFSQVFTDLPAAA